MFKKPLLLNTSLIIISGLLIFNLSRMWISFSRSQRLEGIMQHAEIVEASTDEPEILKAKKTSLGQYDIIGTRNVFRPERREWTAPPPAPPKPKPAPVVKKGPEPYIPPPLPDPAVMGIILEDDGERIAIMQGHRREKVQVRTTGRRRRRVPRQIPDRIVADRMKTYHEGDTISEAVILEIQEDRVIIERDGEQIELGLGNKGAEKVSSSSGKPAARRSSPRVPAARLPKTYKLPETQATGKTETGGKFYGKYPMGLRRERLEKFRASRTGKTSRRRPDKRAEEETRE